MIEINNLVKRYGDKNAVKGISFTVNDGEVLGFLGPNGAGKTTTMNIITGYLSSTSGSVKVNGHDILEEPELAKKEIGYLPENPPLYTDMTVKEYLNFICDLKGVAKETRKNQLENIVAMVKISDVYGRLIGNLSKGYKQRVGIAQALVGNPSILILDEPTVGLDPNQIIEIRRLIKALSKNHSVIISSHILSEIQEIADRVVIINRGKIAAIDTISDLSKRLSGQSKLLLTFRGPVKDAITKIRTVRGISSAVSRVVDSKFSQVEITIAASDTTDTRIAIFDLMAREGWPILEFRSLDPSLEEVFLSITSGKGGVKS
ncbi:ABC-2 type transport system ATP-binding protein [Ruminococcaceae bacterium R-25]|nr:ABC-2 type transport system ATP-binding protein [Ruminococcaceae bacterium R-25]SUQ11209.1 ABC-2 type transport system ATP-binding protein [Oscillospiraceae bacterium]